MFDRVTCTVVLVATLVLFVFGAPMRSLAYDFEPEIQEEIVSQEHYERSTFSKMLASPPVTLLLVLTGSYGFYTLLFAANKGAQSERQQMFGLICVLVLIFMVFYRFSEWLTASRHR